MRMSRLLVLLLLVPVWSWAEKPQTVEIKDLGEACWRLADFDDFVQLRIRATVVDGELDGSFSLAMVWNGPSPNGTLLYAFQGGGTGQQTLDGESVALDMTVQNTNPAVFSGNTIGRLSAVLPLDTLEGVWGADGLGGSERRGGGTFEPITCPEEVMVMFQPNALRSQAGPATGKLFAR